MDGKQSLEEAAKATRREARAAERRVARLARERLLQLRAAAATARLTANLALARDAARALVAAEADAILASRTARTHWQGYAKWVQEQRPSVALPDLFTRTSASGSIVTAPAPRTWRRDVASRQGWSLIAAHGRHDKHAQVTAARMWHQLATHLQRRAAPVFLLIFRLLDRVGTGRIRIHDANRFLSLLLPLAPTREDKAAVLRLAFRAAVRLHRHPAPETSSASTDDLVTLDAPGFVEMCVNLAWAAPLSSLEHIVDAYARHVEMAAQLPEDAEAAAQRTAREVDARTHAYESARLDARLAADAHRRAQHAFARASAEQKAKEEARRETADIVAAASRIEEARRTALAAENERRATARATLEAVVMPKMQRKSWWNDHGGAGSVAAPEVGSSHEASQRQAIVEEGVGHDHAPHGAVKLHGHASAPEMDSSRNANGTGVAGDGDRIRLRPPAAVRRRVHFATRYE